MISDLTLRDLFDRAAGMGGPCAVRFFTAKPEFWDALKRMFPDRPFLEMGAGQGHTIADAQSNGLAWSGMDLQVGSNIQLTNGVMMCNALRAPLFEGVVYMACRPDHSGWVEPALRRALDNGNVACYVGLKKNADRDLYHLLERNHVILHGVGEDDEDMWIFSP